MTEARAVEFSTVVDRLIEHLGARSIVLDEQEPPAAVLWTDPKAEWRSLIEVLQARFGELLVLGDYKPEALTGPAIWIRCLVDGALAEPALPEGRVLIIYLLGVARQDLRAGEECRGGTQAARRTDVPRHHVASAQRKRLGRCDVPHFAQSPGPGHRA